MTSSGGAQSTSSSLNPVVRLENAWHNLMRQLAHTNAGYAVGANQARRHVDRLRGAK